MTTSHRIVKIRFISSGNQTRSSPADDPAADGDCAAVRSDLPNKLRQARQLLHPLQHRARHPDGDGAESGDANHPLRSGGGATVAGAVQRALWVPGTGPHSRLGAGVHQASAHQFRRRHPPLRSEMMTFKISYARANEKTLSEARPPSHRQARLAENDVSTHVPTDMRRSVVLSLPSPSLQAVGIIRQLIQMNLAGPPVLRQQQRWEFDPEVADMRSPGYQAQYGRRGEHLIESLGRGEEGYLGGNGLQKGDNRASYGALAGRLQTELLVPEL
uniref:Uncharacterized protein n=1 Tax=Timema douglasi TaxID=61478 RepID=A0A7R8Z7V9_TIMDO|nr:unnamed protein product [Timema douglasi]